MRGRDERCAAGRIGRRWRQSRWMQQQFESSNRIHVTIECPAIMRSLMSRKAARTIYRTLLVVASFDDYYIWYMLVGILLRDVWRRAVDVSEVLGYVATSTRVDGCVDDTTWPCVTKQKPAYGLWSQKSSVSESVSEFLSTGTVVLCEPKLHVIPFCGWVRGGFGKSPWRD